MDVKIEDVIKHLKNNASSVTSIAALKAVSGFSCFQKVLADVINCSFQEGVFPHQLKLTKVVPIHKSGKRTEVSYYRPISLLSTFSKLYEKLMHYMVDSFLNTQNTFHSNQFG